MSRLEAYIGSCNYLSFKNGILSILAFLLCLTYISCNIENVQNAIVNDIPVYTGMSATNMGNVSISRALQTDKARYLLSDVDYYVRPNENIKVDIHFLNPKDYLILSFFLNDVQYSALYSQTSSRYFAYDPDLDTITITLNIGSIPGISGYKLSKIKYISNTSIINDAEKLDVSIQADENIVFGIQNALLLDVGNGSKISEVSAMSGSQIPSFEIPQMVGYTFIGWYDDASLVNAAIIPDTMPSNDLVLFAKWQRNKLSLNIAWGVATTSRTISPVIGLPKTYKIIIHPSLGEDSVIDNLTGNSYTITELEPAIYSINIIGYDDNSHAVLSGNGNIDLSMIMDTADIIINMGLSVTGNGQLHLTFDMSQAGFEISNLTVAISKTNNSYDITPLVFNSGNNIFIISEDVFPAGQWYFSARVYNATGIAVLSIMEILNVYENIDTEASRTFNSGDFYMP
jgi:uncharacterized repeat protein (TIGR02543 family)